MKLGICQIDTIIGDLEGNKKKIIEGYEWGKENGCDIVVFPELALTGYPPLDFVEKSEFRVAAKLKADEIAKVTNKDTAILFGSITEIEDNVGTNIYNSAILAFDGHIQFIQDKTLIPNYDVFDEVRYFESAHDIGVFRFKNEILGISICEDIWNDEDYWKKRLYPLDPVEKLIKYGATLLINISASPYSFGKRKTRYNMLHTLTSTNSVPLAYVCCVGAQTDLIFDGASMCFGSDGELVKVGNLYGEERFIFDTSEDTAPVSISDEVFEEEIINSLVTGIRDYAVKSGFSKALIGLSGGIDSAIVTWLAVQALGKDNVHVVLMPSKYSSEGSVNDSLKLIQNLGISHDTISIQPVVDKLLEVMTPYFGGLAPDITEENMQSRTRGLYLMSLANKFRYLLLTTGNKSEMATGYATLYGDMCGALAVIADVYKTDIYRLSRYINRNGEVIPGEIITKAPSAELKPDQKDQDTLPPYEVLDTILKMYLEENKEINEISAVVKDRELVKRVLKMVDMNEFKRKQAAPALRVSNKAFGYGRRFPIVQKWSRE